MSRLDNFNRHIAGNMDSLAYPPTGGIFKVVVLGIALPLIIAYYAYYAWTTEQAVWFGKRSKLIIHGLEAQWMASVYFSVGFFCFSRWCIGCLGSCKLFEIGTVFSILLFLISLSMALWHVVT